MSSSTRFIGPSIAFAIILMLGSGIYLKIRGSSEEEGSSDDGGGPRPEVSAATTFRTDIAIPVSGAEVVRDTLVVSVTAAGEAAAFRESRILAQVEGALAELPVTENQRVRVDALVAALDTMDLALAVEEAEAQLASAEAQYREFILFDDQIEDPEVRAERDRVARAKSNLDQREVALRRARLQLERARILAPFEGRVSSIEVSQGHRVRVGDELMTIVDIDPIKVEVQVLESEIGYLAAGRQAQVTFAAFPGEVFVGRIQTINPKVERDSRTARVTVTIPNRNGRILPGMYARVSLEARRFPDLVLVPKASILERDRRQMLFVFEGEEAEGLAKWTYVTTGLENDSLIEIVDHPDTAVPDPGRIVLVDGHYTLIHDARVRISNDLRSEEGARPR